jgi:glutamate 5-kinase
VPMADERQALLKHVRTAVVKVGTTVLTGIGGRLDRERIVLLAGEVARLRERGLRAAIVSSGAIGAGMGELGLEHRPDTLPQLQAAAAVGQGQLMRAYDEAFKGHGLRTGQVLLTGDDLNNRLRYLNARNTLFALLDFGAVPVINENDTTSVEEIAFGDNDFLAAQVTNLLQAELLVILTATDGLRRPGADGRLGERIDVVPEVTEDVLGLASAEGTALGRGGMASKLQAARIATRSGEAVIIADGRQAGVLGAIFAAEPVGTLFLPSARRMASRKRWIAFGVRPKGKVRVDEGARRALVEQGRSLLPSGVVEVRGEFHRGDVVELEDAEGRVFGRGLTNYSSAEVQELRGRKTSEIASALGAKPYDEIVHRDNMVILEEHRPNGKEQGHRA